MDVQTASSRVKRWVVWLSCFGYAAKGFVYIIVGGLAARAALGLGGKTIGSRGALQTLFAQPLGWIILSATVAGLSGYALWRLVQALWDPEGKGRSPKGLLKRSGYLLSGLAYVGLSFSALLLVLGLDRVDYKNSEDVWAARVLAQPLGRWWMGAVALVVFGLALNQFIIAYGAMFRAKLKLREMSPAERRWATLLGRVGLVARGIVLSVIGWFLTEVALEADPEQAGGLEEALDALVFGPYGAWVLAGVGVGLVAYGAYAVVQARYRPIYV